MSTRRRFRILRRPRRPMPLRIALFGLVLMGTPTVPGCHHMLPGALGGHAPERPPAEAFGLGPRSSDAGLYRVTLEPGSPLRPRETRTVQVRVRTPSGDPVSEAPISVDGGMPEHGHGLPTRPRAVPNGAPGTYDVQGLRFNMGGWWELRLVIEGPEGTDSLTFNLDL
jgi:hypothetical protein